AHNDLNAEEVKRDLEKARQKLFAVREERIHPHKDDKILTAWNGLMVAGLAKAGRAFNHQEAIEAAKDAIGFIEKQLIVNGRVMVRYREGEVKQEGFIDDYAYLIWGYLELYEASVDISYLKRAKDLASEMIQLFWDEEHGGFYFYGTDNEELLIRPKEFYDGALPSGNSVAALQLVRLGRLTGDYKLEEKVEELFKVSGADVSHYPMGHTYMLMAYLTTQMKMKEAIVFGKDYKEDVFLAYLQKEFHPEVTYLAGTDASVLQDAAPFTADYRVLGERTYYICENFVCHAPETNPEIAIKQIEEGQL
ncbi:thioredoxin domain-containing protein, partial [Pradoshia sp.]